MRICYVAHSTDHFTAPYVDYFAGQGHEVHLVSLCAKNLPNAVNHHPFTSEFDPATQKLGYVWAIPKVRRIIRRIDPDLVHAQYATSNGTLAALAGVRPLVVSARGSDIYDWLHHAIKRRLLRFTLRRADLVNSVSRDLQDKIVALGIPAEKVLLLTQGIEAHRFMIDRSTRRPGPVRLICTRQLRSFYQCDRIMRALVILAEQGHDFQFTFAAGGPEEDTLRRQAAQHQLSARVQFLGGYGNAELPAILADADVYVSASPWDGTSPALLEAMASGAFPVVSDTPANREWLAVDGRALLFKPDSDVQLAAFLSQAIRDPQLRGDAVEPNRQRVARDGDRATNMSCLASHYERLVSDRASA